MKMTVWAKFNIHSGIEWSRDKFELSKENRNLLQEHGFTGHSDFLQYPSDEFYRLLELVGDKYPFFFKPIPELTKKEMDNQKAFLFDSVSLIPTKNAPYYSRMDDVPFERRYYNPESIFYVHTRTTAEINGSMVWKPDYFKSTDGNIIRLAVPQHIKDLIEADNITGCCFGTIKQKTKKTIEPAYVISADSLMVEDFIIDKLSVIEEYENEPTKSISHTGAFIFKKGALDSIKDFAYLNKATSIGHTSDMIVSQKFRQFYIQHKLKGGRFENVFEVGTDSFEWYNETIKSLAKDLVSHNKDHTIGWTSYTPANELLDGII